MLLRERYAEPWAISVPDETVLRKLTGAGSSTRVLPFHFVLRGGFRLDDGDTKTTLVGARELAICLGGQAHVMSLGKGRNPVPLADVIGRASRNMGSGPSGGTEMICGLLSLRGASLNPLLSVLPKIAVMATDGPHARPLVKSIVELLVAEVDFGRSASGSALRLAEILCTEALSSCAARGWFSAWADERVGRALARIHEAPGMSWTVSELSKAAVMSPSRFAALFRQVVGQSPMVYVNTVRIDHACRLLRSGNTSISAIAYQVGYEDVTAFTRSFKRLTGETPARLRGQLP